MTVKTTALTRLARLPLAVSLLIAVSACSGLQKPAEGARMNFAAPHESVSGVDRDKLERAVAVARELRADGRRVWCVPFARNATGIELRGNAGTWWSKASGLYARSHTPKPGAVMAFSPTRKMPMGHVAVVSEIVSAREIRIDHANWHRNKVSLGMSVFDVSKNNDWSSVRVMSQPNAAGGIYPVAGFISHSAG